MANRKKLIGKNDTKNPFVCLDHGPDSRLWHAISMKDERNAYTQPICIQLTLFYDLPNKKKRLRICSLVLYENKWTNKQTNEKKKLTIIMCLANANAPTMDTHIFAYEFDNENVYMESQNGMCVWLYIFRCDIECACNASVCASKHNIKANRKFFNKKIHSFIALVQAPCLQYFKTDVQIYTIWLWYLCICWYNISQSRRLTIYARINALRKQSYKMTANCIQQMEIFQDTLNGCERDRKSN